MVIKICTSFSGCGTGTLKTTAASIQCSSDPCTITECCDAAINNNGNAPSADSSSKTPTSADAADSPSAETEFASESSCTAITVAATTIMLSCVSLFLNSFL